MSLERLELLAAAQTRRHARETLTLAQAIASGMGDGKAWKVVQQRLLKEARNGLE